MQNTRLNLIDLDQDAEGYRKFLSCWVSRSDNVTFIVDPGPVSSVDYLIGELRSFGIDKLDFVLLTHIHLDHGGGVAKVLNAFPDARIYCHKSGVKHIVNPARLWEGSKKVLKEVADMYGEPSPVSPDKMIAEEDLAAAGIEVIHTPGHAVHHDAFLHDGTLFIGEAFGTHVELPSGRLYLRPATPPRFFLQQALDSLDRILELPDEPLRTAFAHWGMRDGAFLYARAVKKQLILWTDSISELVKQSTDNLEQRLFDRLMKIDPLYGQGLFDELDDDLKVRERHFLGNTLEGMLGFIESFEAK